MATAKGAGTKRRKAKCQKWFNVFPKMSEMRGVPNSYGVPKLKCNGWKYKLRLG